MSSDSVIYEMLRGLTNEMQSLTLSNQRLEQNQLAINTELRAICQGTVRIPNVSSPSPQDRTQMPFPEANVSHHVPQDSQRLEPRQNSIGVSLTSHLVSPMMSQRVVPPRGSWPFSFHPNQPPAYWTFKPDPSRHLEPLHYTLEKQLESQDPNFLTQIKNQDDYTPGLLTIGLLPVSRVIYVKDYNIRKFNQEKGFLTNYLEPQINKKNKLTISKDPARISFLDNYHPRSLEKAVLRGLRPIVTQEIAHKNLTAQAVNYCGSLVAHSVIRQPDDLTQAWGWQSRAIDASGVRLRPELIGIRPWSIYASEIVRRFPNPNQYIQEFGESVYFNGLLTKGVYILNKPMETDALTIAIWFNFFKNAIRYVMAQQFKLVEVNVPNPPEALPYFQVKLAFERIMPDGHQHTQYMTILKGITVRDLTQIDAKLDKIRPDLKSQIEELYQGSDITSEAAEVWQLDTRRFLVEKIDVTRNGGASIAITHRSHRYKTLTKPWGVIVDYNSTEGGCFLKILSEVIKNLPPPTQRTPIGGGSPIPDGDTTSLSSSSLDATISGVRRTTYKTLWKELDQKLATSTYCCEGVSTEWADRAAALYEIDLTIHDDAGTIIWNTPKPRKHQLRLMFSQDSTGCGHYSLVKAYMPMLLEKERKPRFVKSKQKAETPDVRNISVYYDLETVYTNELLADSMVIPYSIAWVIDDDEIPKSLVTSPTFDIFDGMIQDLHQKFNSWVLNYDFPSFTHIYFNLIAYNGSRFDHHQIFRYFSAKGWDILQAPTTNKVTSLLVYMAEARHSGNLVRAFIRVWDPCLILGRSLEAASKDFGLSLSKFPMSHQDIQAMYEDRETDEKGQTGWDIFMNTKATILEEYNKQDVKVLRELCIKLDENLNPLDLYPRHHKTLAGMCYSTFMKMPGSKPEPVGELEVDLFIRRAIVGGRVAVHPQVIGEKKFEDSAVLVDVVSEYPTMMMKQEFPSGRYYYKLAPTYGPGPSAQDMQEALHYYTQGLLGIWEVIVNNHLPNSYGHTILHHRDSQGFLHWDRAITTPSSYVLPRSTLEDLASQGGSDVHFTGRYVVWEDKSFFFKEYIERFKSLKENEDLLKQKGLKFNSTKRKMGKGGMNGVNGKLGQRNFTSQTRYWSLDKQHELDVYIKKCEHRAQGNSEKRPEVFDNGPCGLFTHRKLSDAEAFHKKGHKPYPVQNAVMIWAYARSYMWKHLFSKMPVYYTDTDSGVVRLQDLKQSETYKLVYDPLSGLNKEFGQFEIEDIGEFNRMIAPAPKTYCLVKDGKVVKYRCKGIRKQDKYSVYNIIAKGSEILYSEPVPLESNPLGFFEGLVGGYRVKVHSWQFRSSIKENRYVHADLVKVFDPIDIGETLEQDDQDSE